MRVDVSVHPLISVIRRENLGDPHPLFAGGEQYVSPRFGGDAERWLRAELAEAGVADRDRLTDFTGMLSIIQTAHTECYGWVTGDGDSYAVLVAAHGNNAFAVIRRGGRVTFRRVRANRLTEALVDRLPEVPPARGESLSVREAELIRSGPRPVLRRPSGASRSEQVRRLDTLLRASRRRGVRLYAARRDEAGKRSRSPGWLDLVDLPDGRWAVYMAAGRGERIVNAVPATPALIATKLGDLLRTAH